MPEPQAETSTETPQVRMFNVNVGRFDGELHVVRVAENELLSSAMSKANFTLTGKEEINTEDGQEVNLNTPVTEGQTYLIVSNYVNA